MKNFIKYWLAKYLVSLRENFIPVHLHAKLKRICDIDPGCNKSGPHFHGEARANQSKFYSWEYEELTKVNYSNFVKASKINQSRGNQGMLSPLRSTCAADYTLDEEKSWFPLSDFVPKEVEEWTREDCIHNIDGERWLDTCLMKQGQERGEEKCQSSVQKRTKKNRSKLKRRKPKQ